MAVIFDIIGAMLIRGAIVLAILNVNVSLHETLYRKTAWSLIAQNLSVTSKTIRADIRQIGYNVSGVPFVSIDTSFISFKSDLYNTGSVKTTNYYLANATALNGKYYYKLYRWVSYGAPLLVGQGITQFRLHYFDAAGNQTSNTSLIKSISVKLKMESTVSFNGAYPSATWERQIFPPNL